MNLTRIHSFENMVIKLYADAILPARLMDLPSPLLDLGTGAGMPGIPIKIACPQLEVVLAESRGNRAAFLETVVSELGLSGIGLYARAVTPAYQVPAAGVITRAVEPIGQTLSRVSGCLQQGGLAIFMKGPGCRDEIAEAAKISPGRFRLADDIDYRIPSTPHKRRLVVFERTDTPVCRQRETAAKKHPVRIIESAQNRAYKELKKLLGGKGAKKQGKALVSGKKQVKETIGEFGRLCLAWISAADRHPPPEELPAHTAWYQLEPKLFQALDVIGTDAPLLLIRVPDIPAWHPDQGLPRGCSLLVPFQDPENVGAVIRSATALGADTVILLAEAAHPFHPKALRASGGAALHARIMQGPSIRELPPGLPVVSLSMEGTSVSQFDFPETFGLLPGMEGPGVPAHLRRASVSIPIRPAVESLNAATAAAIALFAWAQKRSGRPAAS